jgi:lipoyl(octanoyl) transferase
MTESSFTKQQPQDMSVESVFLGCRDYRDVEKLQVLAAQRTRADLILRLIGCEHPSVVTLGVRGNQQDLVPLKTLQMPVLECDRGGQATIHSPGQLVIYPILPVRFLGWGAQDLYKLLSQVSQTVLRDLGIPTEEGKSPGLFLSGKKLVFFGFRIERGVSRHGLSINVSNDLGLFTTIRPCGVSDQAMTSLAQHRVQLSTGQIFDLWQREFLEQACQMSKTRLALKTLEGSLGAVGSAFP